MTARQLSCISLTIFIATAVAGCTPYEKPRSGASDPPPERKRVFFLEAPCEVNVAGIGMVDIEEDYIPGVVACENGNAPPEALKAQAVQARSFLYYKLFVAGDTTLENSQSDQVYSCTSRLPNGPLPQHIEAADATRGQYLEWEGNIVASFYVAGAIPPNPDPNDPWNSCMPNGGNDPTSTQRWVTYNRGKSGCDIDMTNLGFVPADCRDNPYNRGCASQNGQTCLANAGVDYTQMFSMFYGDDIELVVAEGNCGADPFSPEDEFCIDNGPGTTCLDAATRVECEAGRASVVEECPNGCGEAECLPDPDPTFCTGKADGAFCDGASRVECAGEQVSLTEACANGCSNGVCQASPPTNNGTGNNTSGTNNDTGAGSDNNDSGRPGQTGGNPGGIPPVVGVSPGVEGGCSVAGNRDASSLWPVLLLGLGLLSQTGRKRRRAPRSPR